VWQEVFEPGAFDSLDGTDPQRVRVNRDHDRSAVVGSVIRFDTHDHRGLVAEVRIARTDRGDETLQLAAERMLFALIGFGIRRGGEQLDHVNRRRRVTSARLDYVSLVMSPAYSGARVLAVRSAIDAHLDNPTTAWVQMRLDPAFRWARQRIAQSRRR
jgi:HK97 family phage prohead protease